MSLENYEKTRLYTQKRKELTERLKQTLIDRLSLDREVEEIPDDCMFFGIGLGLDSVDVLEVVVAIESEFNIRVEDEDMSQIRSVNSIIDFILKKQTHVEGV